MSVTINKTEYCVGCPCMELYLHTKQVPTGDGEVKLIDDLDCKHSTACERMRYIMRLQKDYILQEVCSFIPENTANKMKDLAKKSVEDAFNPEVIRSKQRVIHCKLDDLLGGEQDGSL